ncbi:MAG: hypothetical protein H0X53_00110 [Sphingomonas sp.]|nr:hypothetical protein [Sphingomonas sp.]
MIATLLIATASPMSAVDAEIAFARDSQQIGQWTAFRKWAADDAWMFVPQPVHAQQWLKGRKDPPESVRWSASESYVSCDGSFAVNTGPWTRDGGTRHGYFATVWKRQDESWRWTYDAGDDLPKPRLAFEQPRERAASCEGTPTTTAEAPATDGASSGSGASPDGTLRWSWIVMPDGARAFRTFLWNGSSYEQVIADTVEPK